MIELEVQKRVGDFMLDAGFSAPATGVIALFGPSGCGKTTLINTIAGLLRPDRGSITIGHETLFSSAQRIDLPPARRRIGYVFQEGRLFPHYSVRGNLRYGMPRDKAKASIEFDAVIALLGLEHLLDRRPGDLSGGEKQRVAIGRALLTQPKLLLMDEPLASLDESRKEEIMPFIEGLRDELHMPVIYVSHDMDEVIRLADTLVLMEAGKVAAIGPVEELTSRIDLRPLTGRYDSGAVLRASVAGHDVSFGLSELAFSGGRLKVARVALPLGTPVRVRIRAQDVALATTKPEKISIRNILPARILEIAPDPERKNVIDVRLDIGKDGQPVILWAWVTVRAARELGLDQGMQVYALIKTVALNRGSYGRFTPAAAEFAENDSI